MAMDYLHKTFTTTMYFFPPFTPGTAVPSPPPSPPSPTPVPASGAFGIGQGGDRYPVRVRWFYCAPTAKILPYVHAFASSGWDMPPEWNPFVGEVHQFDRFPAYASRVLPTTATGQRACGTAQQWANGLAAIPAFGVRYDDQGIPFCCGTQLGAPAVGNFGFGSATTGAVNRIGLNAFTLPGGAIGFTVVAHPAIGGIGLTSVPVSSGPVVFAAVSPATEDLGLTSPPLPAIADLAIGAITPAAEDLGLTYRPLDRPIDRIGLGGLAVPASSGPVVFAAVIPAAEDLGLTSPPLPAIGNLAIGASVPSGGAIVFHCPAIVGPFALSLGAQVVPVSPLVVSGIMPAGEAIGLSGIDLGGGVVVWSGYAANELQQLGMGAIMPARDDAAIGTPVPTLSGVGLQSFAVEPAGLAASGPLLAMLPGLVAAGLIPSSGSMGFS